MHSEKKSIGIILRKIKKNGKKIYKIFPIFITGKACTQGYLTGQAGDSAQRTSGTKRNDVSFETSETWWRASRNRQKVNPKEVIYKVQKTIHAQDVVEFRNHSLTPSYEYTLGEDVPAGTLVTARYKKGSEIRIGDQVYRTKNAVLLEKIVQDYLRTNEQVSVQGHCGPKRTASVLNRHFERADNLLLEEKSVRKRKKEQSMNRIFVRYCKRQETVRFILKSFL